MYQKQIAELMENEPTVVSVECVHFVVEVYATSVLDARSVSSNDAMSVTDARCVHDFKE